MLKNTSLATKFGVLSLMVCTSIVSSVATLGSTALAQRVLDPRPRLNSIEAQNFQNRQQLYRLETNSRQNAAAQRGCR